MTYDGKGERVPVQGEHPPRAQRPWMLTGVAVTGFIAAGIEIIGGFVLLIGGSAVGVLESASEDLGGEGGAIGGMMVLLGLASLAVGGCYIWAGVAALGGKNGVVPLVVAGVAAVLNLITLLASEGDAGILGLVLAALVLGLLLAPDSRQFIRGNGGKAF